MKQDNTLPRWCLIASGVVFLALAGAFPIGLGMMREHGADGVSAVFTPGPQSLQDAFNAISTSVSVIASIGVAAIAVVFERARPSTRSLWLAVFSLWVYCGDITYLLYLAVIRPLTGTAPSLLQLGIVLGLIPLGLGSTFLTLASIVEKSGN
jgi:hypothetical protein